MAKAQSAIEMITVYSWAFIILAVLLAVVALIAINPPQNYVVSNCQINPSFPCLGSIITAPSRYVPIQYTIVFNNELGAPVYFAVNSVNVTTQNIGYNGTQYWNGTCSPRLAAVGSRIYCVANISGQLLPGIGTQVSNRLVLSYSICSSDNAMSCNSGNYLTTGNSYQSVSNASAIFNSLTFYTTPRAGSIYINGIAYANNTTAILPSGSYLIYASPISGYTFNSWSTNGYPIGALITNSNSINTTITINAANGKFGSVTANYISQTG